MRDIIIETLKDIVGGKTILAAPAIQIEDLQRSLEILKKDNEFKEFKKRFVDVRSKLAKEANISDEQATSLINYALHIK